LEVGVIPKGAIFGEIGSEPWSLSISIVVSFQPRKKRKTRNCNAVGEVSINDVIQFPLEGSRDNLEFTSSEIRIDSHVLKC